MSFNVPWTQPYPGLSKCPPSAIKRITVEIPLGDAEDILKCTLNSVILTTIAQYALRQTAEMIRTKQLTYADSRAFLQHICKRSYSEFVKETAESVHRGGASAVLEGVEDVGDKPAGTREKASSGRGGKGRATGEKSGSK